MPFVYFHRSDGQHFHRDKEGRYVVDERHGERDDQRHDRTKRGSAGSQRPHDFSSLCDWGNMVIDYGTSHTEN